MHPQRMSQLDIDRALYPTDRVFQRWARSVGAGLPVTEFTGEEARPTELPNDAAIWIDQYVCHCHERMRHFLHCWYRSQDHSAKIARRFNVGREEVYTLWEACLIEATKAFMDAPPYVAKL